LLDDLGPEIYLLYGGVLVAIAHCGWFADWRAG
jgi:hypothetical protein